MSRRETMPFPIGIGDILAARFWSVLDEQGAVNTLNYVCTAKAGTGGSDQDLASFLDAGSASFFRALYPNTVEYRGCQVYFLKRLGVLTAAAPVKSVAGAGVGTATGPPMPRNSAAILKYSTGLRGPANRGRIYLPFISTDHQSSNGRPTTAFDVLVNSFASGLPSPVTVGSGGNTSTLAWSLLHKVKGAVPIDRGPIVLAESADKYGQLHRRGDYGRANASPI
jgi:hypothetical protein